MPRSGKAFHRSVPGRPKWWDTPLGQAFLQVSCAFCGAFRGQPCTTVLKRQPGQRGPLATATHIKDTAHSARWERATQMGYLPLKEEKDNGNTEPLEDS